MQDEKADEEFPTGRQDVPAERDTLHRSPQQDPTQDLWVRWVDQSRPEETSLVQAVLVFDAISRSRGVWRVLPRRGRKLRGRAAPGCARAGPIPTAANRSHSQRVISSASSHVCVGIAAPNASREGAGLSPPISSEAPAGEVPHPSTPPKGVGRDEQGGLPSPSAPFLSACGHCPLSLQSGLRWPPPLSVPA